MRVTFGTIGLVALALFVHDAAACSCAPPPPTKEALAAATAVFSGKVVEIKQEQQFAPKQVTIEIERSWKGTDGRRVVVTTAANGGTCGYEFQQGKGYLVYCYGEKDKLGTNICTRTKTLDAAANDLKDLGEGNVPQGDAQGQKRQ